MIVSLAKCPPPRKFRPAGLLQHVEWPAEGPRPLKGKRKRYTPVQKVGLGFERKVQDLFVERYPHYVPSPWLRFLERGPDRRWRWCQPDGVFVDFDAGRVTIVEVKLRHTSGAWWQVRRLYEPVLKHLFGGDWSFSAVEVVRWFDGTIPFPEEYAMSPDPSRVRNGHFGVHIAGSRL